MGLNMNQFNAPALASYAGNTTGNLGLKFAVERPPVQPVSSEGMMNGIAAGISKYGDNKRQDAQRAEATQLTRDQMAQQMQMKKMDMAQQDKQFQQHFDRGLLDAAQKQAKEMKKEGIEQRTAMSATYINSPELRKSEPLTKEYVDTMVKKGLMTEDEATTFLESPPERRAFLAKMDFTVGLKAAQIAKAVNPEGVAGGKAPAGYEKNPDAPGLRKTPGGPADKLNLGDAGKQAGIVPGMADLGSAYKIFAPDGKPDYKAITAGQSIGPIDGVPYTKGREARQAFERALMTKLRIDTGAAIHADETVKYSVMFMPNPLDNEASIMAKKRQLEWWFKNANAGVKEGMSSQEKVDAMYKKAQEATSMDFSKQDASPEGVSEADIQHTMQKHNVTREQVLERLRGK